MCQEAFSDLDLIPVSRGLAKPAFPASEASVEPRSGEQVALNATYDMQPATCNMQYATCNNHTLHVTLTCKIQDAACNM